jgi:pyruvate dehydrogenase E1 component alpha subunit
VTFRFNGHLIGDMGEYIPKAEYATAVANDPYPKYRAWLIAQGHAQPGELDAIDREIVQQIDEAEAFALQSPPPDRVEVKRDVYADEIA